jgi:hypothetical protein
MVQLMVEKEVARKDKVREPELAVWMDDNWVAD